MLETHLEEVFWRKSDLVIKEIFCLARFWQASNVLVLDNNTRVTML
jgi:hypothetical protein